MQLSTLRFLLLAVLLGLAAWSARADEPIDALWRDVPWGATSDEIARHFGARARRLASPIDFGDSYVDVVVRDVPVGGYGLIAFFQMDKRTGRLKRIQLERPRHSVSPNAALGVLRALEAEYGAPDGACSAPPRAGNGYQANGERVWLRDGEAIRLVVRDTNFDPGAGCSFGGGAVFGLCGLPAQILVRVSPAPPPDRAGCG